ncbi:helix-turn-helix domain-containing protein [Naumannella sp. ID2617S]|nr:helix-turn-helix domain-containing protein [Naumannella sp. ID2617S]
MNRCPWSDLPTNQCDHCTNPHRTPTEIRHAQTAAEDPNNQWQPTKPFVFVARHTTLTDEQLADLTDRFGVVRLGTNWEHITTHPKGRTWQHNTNGDHQDPPQVWCDHDAPDNTWPCDYCLDQIARQLGDLPWLLNELDQATARNTRFVDHGTSRDDTTHTDEAPLPINLTTATARTRITTSLTNWPARTHPDPIIASRQLLTHLTQLRDRNPHQLAQAAWHTTTAIRAAHRTIDRPPDLTYLGLCPNDHPLYAARDATTITCNHTHGSHPCGYTSTITNHRRKALDAGENRWLTIDELVGAITLAGEPVTRRQLHHWINHDGLARETRPIPRWDNGQLITETVDVYRLGDVRERAALADLERDSLTSDEAATQLGVTRNYIRVLVQRGHLTPIRPGAKPLRFTSTDIATYAKTTRRREA